MKAHLLLVAFAVAVSSCGRVSVDVRRPGQKNPDVERGKTVGKTLYNGWKVADAWGDALDKITPEDEIALGQMATIEVIAMVGDLVLEDENLLRYLNSVGNLVALQGSRQTDGPRNKSRRFFFAAIRNDLPNALSTPGGNVLVTTGLLERLNSESELAFVLGHEIAHIDREHGLLALKGALGGSEALKSALELSLRKDKNKEPITNLFDDAKVYEKTSSVLSGFLVGKANLFSAAQERDADEDGLRYMSKAGYDPAAGARVLEILREASSDKGWTLSHGSPEKRAEALASLTKSLPPGKSGFTRWQSALARLEAAQAAVAARATPASTPAAP